MVKGVDIFREFFKDFTDNYILIGGAACDEHMAEAGLTFRATKDLDLMLIVEALNPKFVEKFWEFVKSGNYGDRQKSEGDRKYYRFLKPKNEDYPEQMETPGSITIDMNEFVEMIKPEPPDYRAIAKNIRIPEINGDSIVKQIKHTFSL